MHRPKPLRPSVLASEGEVVLQQPPALALGPLAPPPTPPPISLGAPPQYPALDPAKTWINHAHFHSPVVSPYASPCPSPPLTNRSAGVPHSPSMSRRTHEVGHEPPSQSYLYYIQQQNSLALQQQQQQQQAYAPMPPFPRTHQNPFLRHS
eukprot:TRINITY_DN1527_c0_g1_i3.p1 TRINITY_DN1527_c0_g1~~TRINITY_DN1527_c0_g1_i3.p1  ORF type:complete len:150 (-),score=20.90 TRINITY_DN1527_c0_g1_i3:102-551(-)